MKYIKLRNLASRISLGAMGMSRSYTGAGSDDAESIRTIQRALDLCVTLLMNLGDQITTNTRG